MQFSAGAAEARSGNELTNKGVVMSRGQGIKIVPIIVGVLVQLVGTVATALLLVISLSASGFEDYEIIPRMHSFSGLMLSVIAGLGFTAVGGYFAGQMAARRPVLHGTITAAIGLLLTFLCREAGLPLWFGILSLGGMIPAGMAGGYVAGREFGIGRRDIRKNDRPE
jgi:hypothetical protein